MKNSQKLAWTAAVALLVAVLFWNPFTRSVILFILPLGSGIDDLIFIAALILAAVFSVIWYLQKRKEG